MRIAPTRALSTVLLVLAFVAAAIALTACTPTVPTTPPGITGAIVSVVPGDERPASMLVEGGAQAAGAASDKASITINPSTLFFDAAGKPTKASGAVVGTNVRVWFSGPVAESYPVQGSAQAVQLLAK